MKKNSKFKALSSSSYVQNFQTTDTQAAYLRTCQECNRSSSSPAKPLLDLRHPF